MSARKLTIAEVKEEIKSSKMVLVDIFSIHCGPCKMLLPVYDEVAQELEGVSVVKLDADENDGAGPEFNVSSIPAVILYKNGEEVDRFVGFKPKDAIIEWVTSHK